VIAVWRTTLRIARRTALRHRGRSALILAMIAVPVFAGTALEVARHTAKASAQQQRIWQFGAADALLYPTTDDKLPALRKSLPPGTKAAAYSDGTLSLRTQTGQTSVRAVAADLSNPMFAGMYRLTAGRYPRQRDEIVVSPSLAKSRGLRVGGTVRLATPDRTARVVGLAESAADLGTHLLVVPRAIPVEGSSRLLVIPPRGETAEQLIAAVRPSGSMVASDTTSPTPGSWIERYGVTLVVVGFAGTEIVLLAGSAFAVGARRSRRELGLIAAAGGATRHVGLVVLGGGIVLGLSGAILGGSLGVFAAWAGRPILQRVTGHVLRPTVVPVTELCVLAVLAVLATVIAAAAPAHWASRQPVLDALTGRSAQPGRSPRRVVAIGLGVVLVGAALVYLGATRPVRPELVAIGSAVGLLGFALCAPSLVAAAGRLAPLLPLSARLAVRDAARHRNRTGAAVAAVTAAVAGSVALSLYFASSADNRDQQTAAPTGQVSLLGDSAALAKLRAADLTAMASAVRARAAVPLWELSGSPELLLNPAGPGSASIGVGGADVIRLVTGKDAPAAALRTLDRGGMVVFQQSTGALVRADNNTTQTLHLPTYVVRGGHSYFSLPGGVVSKATARRLGVHPVLGSIVLDTPRAPDTAQLETVNRLLAKALGTGAPLVSTSIATPDTNSNTSTILLLAAASAFVTLAATGIAVGLSAAESREDVILLAAVGAAPRVRRVLSAAQAGLISILGTILGIPAGIIPAAGVIGTHSDTLRFVVPWGPLALGCLVAPLAVTVLSALTTRSRLPMPRRLT
jgi:putative ABC transport system permease protein